MKVKVLLKHSQYGIPILIFLSIVPQFYYYSLFGIDLGSYISIFETPLLFKGNYIYVFLAALIIYFIIISLFGKTLGSSNTQVIKTISKHSRSKRLLFYLKDDILLIIVIIIYSILAYIKEDLNFILPAVMMGAPMLFNIFIKESIIENKLEFNEETTTALNSLQLLFALMVLFLLLANREAYNIQTKNADKSITIITEKRTIYCKYTLQYIGRTKDYTFIYDQKRKRTEVIKNSDIIAEKKEAK